MADRRRVAFLALHLFSAGALLGAAAAQAADPCLVFVHGKRNGATGPDWTEARDYWTSGSHDFIETATNGFTLSHYVVAYHGDVPWWHADSAGIVATEIVRAADGLPDAGGNSCPSAQSGGTFWVVAHSMGATVMDYVLGNADPSAPNYNANGPYDQAASLLTLVISVSGAHRGSELADAACGDNNPICNLGATIIQGCGDANFWLRSDEAVQVRAAAGPPARLVYLTGGYEAIFGPSICLSGEDDGVVQYASQFACAGSATASYDNDDVCGNAFKQETLGFWNLDGSHENHADTARDTDSDTRRSIPGGVWYCGASPCAPDTQVASSLSSAELVDKLLTDGFQLNKTGGSSCGLGYEIALVLPLLAGRRRRAA